VAEKKGFNSWTQRYPPYIKLWFVMTIFTLAASVVMAMSFLLQVIKN
jgi:hypothetical protein